MVSIKVLSTSLVLMCIVLTAFICTFLAISSSDVALDDTKESRDTSVDSCFDVGEESVQNRTTEYLDLLLSNVVEYVEQFLQPQVMYASGVAKELEAQPWDTVKNWNYHNPARYYWAMKHLRDGGCTSAGIYLQNNMAMFYTEDVATVANPNDGYHDIFGYFNFGSDHPSGWGGNGLHFSASVGAKTGRPIITNPLTDINMNQDTCNKTSLASNGTIPDEPCTRGWSADYWSSLTTFLSTLIAQGDQFWLPMQPIDTYLTINMLTPIYHDGFQSGYVISGADLRHVSKFLKDMDIGGPVYGYPSRSRIFITIRNHWMDYSAKGLLIGSSHGNVTAPTTVLPILPKVSTDDIVRNIAILNEEEETDLEGLGTSHNMTVLNITTDYAPQGEDFFYRVGILTDGQGTNWFVHVAMDRAYILGSIDNKTAETKEAISIAEKKVDDDLEAARSLLYALVAICAVGLILISVVFMMRIIQPLVVLEKEMALVAVMKLEMVDTSRPLSSLQEVRLMQVSFLQMIKNLVEYRNYMPASVLQDDSEVEDSEEHEVSTQGSDKASRSSKGTNSKRDMSSKHSSSQQAVKHHTIGLTEAKHKKVALLSCNMISFLSEVESTTGLLRLISDYLSMALTHVKATKGIPDSFSGDRLYASWNGVRPCSSHRTAAYNCAKEIVANPIGSKTYSIGIVSGDVRCGNMGCDGMKKYTFVGSLSSWVHIVERIGRSSGSEITIDGLVREEVANVAFTRYIQHVIYEKHSSNKLFLFQASGEKEVKEEEWMYQLEAGNSNDPYKAYNVSFQQFMEGNVEEAAATLETVADDGTNVMKKYKARLADAAQNPILCDPIGKTDTLVS